MKVVSLILQGSIRGYQLLVSPFFPPSCRYWPSCSEYARQSVVTHGPGKGAWLAVRRLLRCHPWGSWGYDPVPEKASAQKTAANAAAGLGLGADCCHLDQQTGR